MAARLFAVGLGLWLLLAPAVCGYGGPGAVNDRVVGPLVTALAVVALAPAARGLRWLHAPLGAWLVVAPVFLGYTTAAPFWTDVGVGLALLVCTPFGVTPVARLGGGWRTVWRTERP